MDSNNRVRLEHVSHKSMDGFFVRTNLATSLDELAKKISNAWTGFSNQPVQTQKSNEPGIVHILRYGPRELLKMQQIGEAQDLSRYYYINKGQHVNSEIYSKFHFYLYDIINTNQVSKT